MRLFFSGLLLTLLLAGHAAAMDWTRQSLAEAVEHADLIVLATTRSGEGTGGTLEVEKVLKGPDTEHVYLDHLGLFQSDPLSDGQRGVFLIGRGFMGDGTLFHPMAIQIAPDPRERVEAVRRVQRMLEDPVPFIEQQDLPDEDLIYVLGQKLSALRISSPLAAQLGSLGLGGRYGRQIPWEIHDRLTVTVQLEPGPEPKLTLATAQPDSPLLPYLRDRLTRLIPSHKQFLRQWENQFEVTLDTRQPQRVGSLDADAVRAYLRRALRTETNDDKRQDLLDALALARDIEAIDDVAALLHDDDGIGQQAAGWLGQTRSPRAREPLREVIYEAGLERPGWQPLVVAAAHALCAMRDVEALAALRRAAGVSAHYSVRALAEYGEAQDFEVILHAGIASIWDSCEVQPALCTLVRRSNKPEEPWMAATDPRLWPHVKPQWEAWWQENQGDFQIVRE